MNHYCHKDERWIEKNSRGTPIITVCPECRDEKMSMLGHQQLEHPLFEGTSAALDKLTITSETNSSGFTSAAWEVQADMVDVTFRLVEGCGVLPIITVDGEEIYRGEFKNSIAEALEKIDSNFPNLRSSPRFNKEF